MNRPLVIAALAEAATGSALVVAPGLVAQWLSGGEVLGVGLAIGRLTGMALIALGIACWTGPQPTRAALAGMTTYGVLVTAYLVYLGCSGEWAGPLLWPAVALHAVLTILLARTWLGTR